MESLLPEVFEPDRNFVSVNRLAGLLRLTKSELASAAGLSRDAVSKTARLESRATQSRLRDVIEILNHVTPWAGSPLAALAWYRSQPLPSFGDLTAEDLVREGHGDWVKGYLSRIAVGGYA